MLLTDYPWYMTLVAVGIGLVYAAALYFWRRPQGSAALRWALAAVRFVIVAALAWLLLGPVVRRTVHERQKPRLLVATDQSLSIRSGADSAFSLERLYPQLEERFTLVPYPFGDSTHTDIGRPLQEAIDEEVDAVLMATDGVHNRGLSPLSVAARLAAPVHIIALGDTTPIRDASVADVHAGRVALRGNTFGVEITVGAQLMEGQSAMLTVVDAEGHRLWAQRVDYTESSFAQSFAISLPAERAGLQAFDVLLDVLPHEASASNNKVRFYVDVIDMRKRIAIVAHSPHPDVAALRNALASNPNYEVQVLSASDAEKGLLRKDSVQLVVLHNLPSATHPRIDWAADLPTLFIIGLQTDLPRFNALKTGLSIESRAQHSSDVTALFRSAFSLFTLAEADARTIEQWPPLSAPFGQARMGNGLQTLFAARVGQIDSQQPLVCATAQGQRRLFVWGEGLWKWRLAEYATTESHEVFDRWMAQMVAFGAMQQREGRWQVQTQRTYMRGEEATVRATLYNESFEQTNAPEASFEITPVNGQGHEAGRRDYAFRRDGAGYALTLTGLEEGVYRWRAEADGLTEEGSFAVEDMNLEGRHLVADHHLLATLAEATQGGVYSPHQQEELLEALASFKPLIYSHTRYSDLLSSWWVLALLILLLAVEWAVRKYNGEV